MFPTVRLADPKGGRKVRYKAIITLHSEGWMLGGTRKHESTPFESRQDAEDFAVQSVEVNQNRPGYKDADIRYAIVEIPGRRARR